MLISKYTYFVNSYGNQIKTLNKPCNGTCDIFIFPLKEELVQITGLSAGQEGLESELVDAIEKDVVEAIEAVEAVQAAEE